MGHKLVGGVLFMGHSELFLLILPLLPFLPPSSPFLPPSPIYIYSLSPPSPPPSPPLPLPLPSLSPPPPLPLPLPSLLPLPLPSLSLSLSPPQVLVTNTIMHDIHEQRCSKIKTIDISILLAEAIRRIYHGESMSQLFRNIPMED